MPTNPFEPPKEVNDSARSRLLNRNAAMAVLWVCAGLALIVMVAVLTFVGFAMEFWLNPRHWEGR
jgi:hypothetical protein